MSELDEQIALFQFAKVFAGRVPELDLLLHIPNGEFRHKATAARLSAAGVRAGVPDVFLPVARQQRNGVWAHGLWIELKIGTNRTSAFQNWWLSALRAQGFSCKVCYGWVDAACAIVRYLGYAPAVFGLESAVEVAG